VAFLVAYRLAFLMAYRVASEVVNLLKVGHFVIDYLVVAASTTTYYHELTSTNLGSTKPSMYSF